MVVFKVVVRPRPGCNPKPDIKRKDVGFGCSPAQLARREIKPRVTWGLGGGRGGGGRPSCPWAPQAKRNSAPGLRGKKASTLTNAPDLHSQKRSVQTFLSSATPRRGVAQVKVILERARRSHFGTLQHLAYHLPKVMAGKGVILKGLHPRHSAESCVLDRFIPKMAPFP